MYHPRLERVGSRCWYTRYDNELLPAASRQTESHRNERDPEAMKVLDDMVEGRLIRIVWYYLYQQDSSSFWLPIP